MVARLQESDVHGPDVDLVRQALMLPQVVGAEPDGVGEDFGLWVEAMELPRSPLPFAKSPSVLRIGVLD